MKKPKNSFLRDPDKIKSWLDLGVTLLGLIVKAIHYLSK